MRKYLVAVVITGCAFALTLATRGAFQQNVFSFFTCAVALIAYVSGTGPAIFAMVIAILSSAIGLLEPVGSFRIDASTDIVRLIAFTVTSALIIGIVHRLHRTQERLRGTLADLEYIKTARGVWNWSYDVASDRVTWSSYLDDMEIRQERNLRGWLELVHPEDRGVVEEKLRKALITGDLEVDYRIQNSGGTSMVRFLTRAKLTRPHSGHGRRLVGICMEPIAVPRFSVKPVRGQVSGTLV